MGGSLTGRHVLTLAASHLKRVGLEEERDQLLVRRYLAVKVDLNSLGPVLELGRTAYLLVGRVRRSSCRRGSRCPVSPLHDKDSLDERGEGTKGPQGGRHRDEGGALCGVE